MTRKYTWLPATLIYLTTFSISPFAHAQNIAVVNGTPIASTRADALLEEFGRQGQADTPELRTAVREELINREILMQEAARRGLPNRPEIKAQLAIAQQSVVIRALIEDFWQQQKPSDAELRAAYLALTQKMGNKEYHLHHILLDDEAQAKELISKIKSGASFEALAKQYSKDPGSAKNGGDLDWAPLQTYVPEFAQSATRLKPGQITQQPLHTQFGWHIIRVDNTRALKAPSFEQLKPQLTQQIQQEKLQNFIDNLRTHAKIQ